MIVTDLLTTVLTRLSAPATCSLFEALREVQGIIANRLLSRQSELLKADEPAELLFVAGNQKMSLPTDYYALENRPYVQGLGRLDPLAGRDVAVMVTEATPRYFEIVGRTLRIYPAVETDVTVLVPYFFKPATLEALDDELPWDEMFDSVFIEGCIGVMAGGLTVVADRSFVGIIQSQVDAVLATTDMIAEQLLADSINGL